MKIVILTTNGKKIYGNCDLKLGLGVTDTMTAEYFCDLIGTATAETTSIRKSNSLEGELEEYGQKNISTLERNLLNEDEIMRLPFTKLVAVLSRNKPLLLDKMIYTEHPVSKKLRDSPISEYNPKWNKNIKNNAVTVKEKVDKKPIKKQKMSWTTF